LFFAKNFLIQISKNIVQIIKHLCFGSSSSTSVSAQAQVYQFMYQILPLLLLLDVLMSLKQKLESSPVSQPEQKQLKGGGGGEGEEGEVSFASLSNKMDVMFEGIRSLLDNQGKTMDEKVVKLCEGQEAMRNEINHVNQMMMTKAGVVDVVKDVVQEERPKLNATSPVIDKGKGVNKSKSVGARPRDENEDACTVAIGNFEYNSLIEDIEGAGKYYTLDRRCSVCSLVFKELESQIAFLKNQEDKGPFYHNGCKLFIGTKETPQN